MAATAGDAAHWDHTYAQGDTTRSWYQPRPTMSLRLLELADAQPRDSLIDIGGGAALLVDALLARGFRDLTVLDISQTGLATAQQRLGPAASGVTWVHTDVTRWRGQHRYDIWHDRAVFHFLTTPTDQQRYLDTLATALRPGGHVIIGTFAVDGPEHCSGLSVARYTPDTLADVLHPQITTLATHREAHHTPTGATQPFTWLLGQHSTPTVRRPPPTHFSSAPGAGDAS